MQRFEVSVKMPKDPAHETARLIVSLDKKLQDLAASGALADKTVTCVIKVIGRDNAETIPLLEVTK